MAYILKKIGNVSNIPAYHFECDNNEDILEIPLAGVPMSSTCYVINEGTTYTLNSEREWIITMRGGTGGGSGGGITVYSIREDIYNETIDFDGFDPATVVERIKSGEVFDIMYGLSDKPFNNVFDANRARVYLRFNHFQSANSNAVFCGWGENGARFEAIFMEGSSTVSIGYVVAE